ncbi:MAG TPA: GntR family transcriptional regulator [Solirubrobacterales bacterium]
MADNGREGQETQNVVSAHQTLRDAIITSKLAPGTVSSQVALAREFDIGRTPLREALRLLQSEGLVAGDPNRRVRIVDIDAEDLEDLYVLRVLLETTALKLTLPGMTSADIAEIRGFMAQMDHYGNDDDWSGLRGPHKAFHMKFVADGGPRVVKLIDGLFDQGERYRQAFIAVTADEWAERQTEHQGLIDAAVDRDAQRGAELLARHYVRSAELVISNLEPGRPLDRLDSIVATITST